MSDTNDAPTSKGPGLPPELRFLKMLVTALAGTMIIGVITIIGLLVTRLPGARPPLAALPAHLDLPAGTEAEAVTFGQGWIAVVTTAGEILILDPDTGAVRQRVAIGAD